MYYAIRASAAMIGLRNWRNRRVHGANHDQLCDGPDDSAGPTAGGVAAGRGDAMDGSAPAGPAGVGGRGAGPRRGGVAGADVEAVGPLVPGADPTQRGFVRAGHLQRLSADG